MIVYKGVVDVDRDMAGKVRYYLLFGEEGDKTGLTDFIEMVKCVGRDELDSRELEEIVNTKLAQRNKSEDQLKAEQISEIDSRILELTKELNTLMEQKSKLGEVGK